MEFCEKYVVESILSRLPPKSLMRFKCVSKKWYALINNPNFAVSHLFHYSMIHNNNLSSTTTTRVLVKRTDENNNKEVFSILDFCKDNDVVSDHSFLATCEDFTLPMSNLASPSNSLFVVGHCNGIVCLAMTKTMSCEVLLWNPAIREVKALPTLPYVPDHSCTRRGWKYFPDGGWGRFREALGFGYCPKSNDYKVVNINIGYNDLETFYDHTSVYVVPKVAVYASLGTNHNSWRDSRMPYSLETESGVLFPERFQMCFKGMCFWIGEQRHKEIIVFDELSFVWKMIILFHMEDEVFETMALPDDFLVESLLVWNESVAVFGTESNPPFTVSYVIWVMDEADLCKGAWTKHVTIVTIDFASTQIPMALTFLKSDEILLADKNGCLFSFNLGTKHVKYFPDQRVSNESASNFYFEMAGVVYLDSIVSLSRDDIRFKTGDSSDGHDFPLFKYSQSSLFTVETEWHSYSIWAFPPDNVSLRIKKIMDGLRSEFPGPEMEPHIPVVGSIHMTHDEVLSKFNSLQSCVTHSSTAKVTEVVTRNSFYQCVSLIVKGSNELRYATSSCSFHFGLWRDPPMPRLSLICGYLSEEERKIAQEKVQTLDESITSLSFPITRLALYKINRRDPTMKSWEKIAEYPLIY